MSERGHSSLENFLLSRLLFHLHYKPTKDQQHLLAELASFIADRDDNRIFLINGFAGTGKTLVVGSLVKMLAELKQHTVLLAPTGRAAKVLSSYAGMPAYTIHKKIYQQKFVSEGVGLFEIDKNLHSDTLFVVDEASMVANTSYEQSVFGTGRLLDDLVSYVSGGARCRLLLVGDGAQLPPVGYEFSPALDIPTLDGYGGCLSVELSEVVRQAEDSGILMNANKIRANIGTQTLALPRFELKAFQDICRIGGGDVEECVSSAFDTHGVENTVVVCYSNKRAIRYNLFIRGTIFGREEELVPQDRLMVVKNYYLPPQEDDSVSFIANGDIVEVVKIRGYEERYGLRFATVTVRLPDYDGWELDCKLLLDTLTGESASLGQEKSRHLFMSVAEDYAHIGNKRKRYQAIKEDPFYNALQVKYAYAITCHKAQGGQWKTVFIDQPFFRDPLQLEDLRWLYTAFTRAEENLYLINFKTNQ